MITREEAIEVLENGGWWDSLIPVTTIEGRIEDDKLHEALDLAIAALRPFSREQVEKVWRGEWKYSHTSAIDHFAVVKCSKCGHEAYAMALHVIEGNFCPACGATMTDEAVQMVMERMEALWCE